MEAINYFLALVAIAYIALVVWVLVAWWIEGE